MGNEEFIMEYNRTLADYCNRRLDKWKSVILFYRKDDSYEL